MKIAVYKDRDSKEYKLYESCVFDSKYYNPNFICHIDLPIEKPKEEKKTFIPENDYDLDLFVKYLKENGFKPKKTLVTKEVDEIRWRFKDSGKSYEFVTPINAKNVRCTYEVEE